MRRTWLWAGAGVIVLALLYLPSLGIGSWQALAWLLLLLCPLMHFFGFHAHGGHDHGRHTGGANGAAPDRAAAPLEHGDEA